MPASPAKHQKILMFTRKHYRPNLPMKYFDAILASAIKAFRHNLPCCNLTGTMVSARIKGGLHQLSPTRAWTVHKSQRRRCQNAPFHSWQSAPSPHPQLSPDLGSRDLHALYIVTQVPLRISGNELRSLKDASIAEMKRK